MSPLSWIWAAFVFTWFLVLALAVLGVGWLAYRARLAREQRAFAPDVKLPDPAERLAELNTDVARGLADAHRTLRDVETAVRHGVRG